MPKRYGQECPVARAVELLGERWTLLIVRDLLGGARRFQDLLASLPGIAPNVLSARLHLLEAGGVVARRFYSEHPPRAAYALTERGRELGTVVGALAVWGARHLHRGASLVHDACATPLEVGYFCPHCRTRVRGSTARLAPPVAPRATGSAPRRTASAGGGPPTRSSGG
jgi:DNA-binding HxlR family transcriptional regulator